MTLRDKFMECLLPYEARAAGDPGSGLHLCARNTGAVFDGLAALTRSCGPVSIKQFSILGWQRQQQLAAHIAREATSPLPEVLRRGDALGLLSDVQLNRIVLAGTESEARSLNAWGRRPGTYLVGLLELDREMGGISHRIDYSDYILVNDEFLIAALPIDAGVATGEWYLLPTALVERFRHLWTDAHPKAELLRKSAVYSEPLCESADLLRELAENITCEGSYVDSIDCKWYHGVWQYLRLANKVSSPRWHENFFRNGIQRALLTQGSPQVLICGCADYAMLGLVIDELQQAAAQGKIYVVDRCPTPLLSCSWYFRRIKQTNIQVETIRADALTLSLEQLGVERMFDLIVTDAFLTRFSKVPANNILSMWRRVLAPDGHVLTTVRIHDDAEVLDSSAREAQIIRYVSETTKRLRLYRPFIRLPAARLSSMTYAYARRMRSEPLGSADDIENLLADHDLAIDEYDDDAQVPGELEPSRYLRINLTHRSDRTRDHGIGWKHRTESVRPPTRTPAVNLASDAIPHLVNALKRQTEADPSWNRNLSSAVFAAHAHVAIGDLDSWRRIAEWVRSTWIIAKDGSLQFTASITEERKDFDGIARRTYTEYRGTITYDIERFHRSYVTALLINFEGDAPEVDSDRVAHIMHLLDSSMDAGGYPNLLYPATVPWVSARALIGLARLQRQSVVVTDSSLVRKLQAGLLSAANSGWMSMTGGWNTKAQTTALALSALLLSGRSTSDPRIGQAIDELVSLYTLDWSAEIEMLDCADCLYALTLANVSLGAYEIDLESLLGWARKVELLAPPADESLQQGAESSKVPYVLSLMLDLLRLDPEIDPELFAIGHTSGNVPGVSHAEVSGRLQTLLSETSRYQTMVKNWLFAREVDSVTYSSGRLVKPSSTRRLEQLLSEIDSLQTEAKALTTATGTRGIADLENRLNRIRARMTEWS